MIFTAVHLAETVYITLNALSRIFLKYIATKSEKENTFELLFHLRQK
jgi:hypothetical protein